jgi:hypothetical protein
MIVENVSNGKVKTFEPLNGRREELKKTVKAARRASWPLVERVLKLPPKTAVFYPLLPGTNTIDVNSFYAV